MESDLETFIGLGSEVFTAQNLIFITTEIMQDDPFCFRYGFPRSFCGNYG